MKRHTHSSTVLALLVLLLLSTAASDVSRAQRVNGAAKLVVSVTVPPICTVAVTPGQLSAAEAIAVRCRNLPATHPQPLVTELSVAGASTSRPQVLETSMAAIDPLASVTAADAVDPEGAAPLGMVVINF